MAYIRKPKKLNSTYTRILSL